MFLHGDPPLSLTLEEGKAVFPRHAALWSKAVKVRLDGDLHGSGWLSYLGFCACVWLGHRVNYTVT